VVKTISFINQPSLPDIMLALPELVNKYKGETVNVAAGLRASGAIHIGNMATLALAGLVAREIGNDSSVNFKVCDIDPPSRKIWDAKKIGYVRCFDTLPDQEGCHDTVLDHALERIDDYIVELSSILGVRFNMSMFSDIQRKPEFRQGLKRVLDDDELVAFLNAKVKSGNVPVNPLCPDCHTSDLRGALYEDDMLYSRCKNPDCEVGEYSMHILDSSTDLNVHFFLLMMQDKIVQPFADIHVYGGDYEHNKPGMIPKMEKINRVIMAAGGSVPDSCFGPYFVDPYGKEQSKSSGNGVSIDHMKESIGDAYAEKVVELVEDIVAQKLERVPYEMVRQRFELD